MICYFAFVTRIATVISRDDARLVPCGSHLWAIQPMWRIATIEIHGVVMEIFMPLMATGDSLTDV